MKTLLMLATVTVALTTSAAESDPYLWLEEVTGDKALAWAEAHNALTVDKLATGESFQMLETRLRTILDSKDRIPYIRKAGQFYYNFWRDEANPRGQGFQNGYRWSGASNGDKGPRENRWLDARVE